ncbi:MAG: lipid biosynthesis lauroyl acyltransferase [Burkholderiales bacterium]|jgi:KDO2-lipid IV(A) lauroyltransferase|nr:lipid biosynthesis lauroyl acyltransferase [Burkholderiales bacterium]
MLHKQIGMTIAFAVIWLINKLPVKITRFIGNILGAIGYLLAGKRRRVGLKNLSLCFPEMSNNEKNKIIYEHFKYLVNSALQYGLLFYGSPNQIRKLVKLKNFEYVMEHYEKRPIILLCPHFVGLDMAASRMTLEIVGYSIYSEQKNSLVGDKLKEARLRFIKDKGGEVFSRKEGLRPVIKRLRETKRVFYYLPDQDLGERDSLYVPFFNHPTCATVNVLPKLVQLTNALVVSVFVYWEDNQYIVEFSKPWENYPTDDLRQNVILMNQVIENMVLRAKPQYFWLHKRFKTQPNIERGSIYNK